MNASCAAAVGTRVQAEVLARLEAEAARRGVGIENVIAELSEALPDTGHQPQPDSGGGLLAGGEAPHRFGFIGMGHSGDGELSTRYKDYRRAATAARNSDDV